MPLCGALGLDGLVLRLLVRSEDRENLRLLSVTKLLHLRLLRVAWGDAALSGEEFDWWFDRNPAGSLMSVAQVNGCKTHR